MTRATHAGTISITVISDVICPWCLIGKRRLERALDAMDLRAAARIAWRPFELNPDMPEEGMDRAAYRARKFGPERGARLDAELAAIGAGEGVRFAFDRMTRTPSTRKAHMLIARASELGRGDAMAEALFTAYFEQARDVGDEGVLADAAVAAGMAREAAVAALRDEALRRRVIAEEAEAARIGVSGVPFFIIDGAWALSGAQPAETWIEALRRLRAGEALAS